MNTHIPEEYGGPGASLPRGLSDRGGARLGLLGHRHLDRRQRPRRRPDRSSAAREEIKKKYLGMLTEAPKLASFCLTEPDAGSDVSGHAHDAPSARATSTSSTARSASSPTAATPTCFTVYAKTDKDAGHRGISAFVVAEGRHGHGGQEGGQDGSAGVQHRDHHLQRHRGPRREPARRGEQGLQARDDDPRPHAPGRRRDGDRHRARGVRVRDATTRRSASSSACRSRCTRRSSS